LNKLVINQKFKYWEFYYDLEDDTQCAATHWTEEWSRLETLLKYTDEELEGLVQDDMHFAKTHRGERVTIRSIKPAVKEFKEIIKELELA
jgi:hypothetical protein